jgi:hypothetical protein
LRTRGDEAIAKPIMTASTDNGCRFAPILQDTTPVQNERETL